MRKTAYDRAVTAAVLQLRGHDKEAISRATVMSMLTKRLLGGGAKAEQSLARAQRWSGHADGQLRKQVGDLQGRTFEQARRNAAQGASKKIDQFGHMAEFKDLASEAAQRGPLADLIRQGQQAYRAANTAASPGVYRSGGRAGRAPMPYRSGGGDGVMPAASIWQRIRNSRPLGRLRGMSDEIFQNPAAMATTVGGLSLGSHLMGGPSPLPNAAAPSMVANTYTG